MTDAASMSTLESQPPPPEGPPPALSIVGLARWAWRQLTSMRTALILLIMLLVAAIPGSLVPQRRVDPLLVARWRSEHPKLTPLYERLDLFNVYGSVWFSSIYILLMVSLVGCILPRLRVYWRGLMAAPPRAPRNLSRLPVSRVGDTDLIADEAAERAAGLLRSRRYRVRVDHEADGSTTVAAQRGYLREAGNLVFHTSLLVVLVSFAIGDLFGYRGASNIVVGQTFTNDRQSYDDFTPGSLFRPERLEPFSLTLDDFTAEYLPAGPQAGQPTSFSARVTYRTTDTDPRTRIVEVNRPLQVSNTGVFLIGNGYAPVVTLRDGRDNVVYSGPTIFLPEDNLYTSWGVIKAPDALPIQLGFEGRFLPTYASAPEVGAYSQFPDLLAPALSLTAYTGDLGFGSGVPQSVYALEKSGLKALTDDAGEALVLTIPLGESVQLPGNLGSLSFDGVERWARLQFSTTPAEPLALGGVVAGLLGLLASLFIRPRRLWLRAYPASTAGSDANPTTIEVAGLDRREGHGLPAAVAELLEHATQHRTPTISETPS